MTIDLNPSQPSLQRFRRADIRWDAHPDREYPYAEQVDRDWDRRAAANRGLWRGQILTVTSAAAGRGHVHLQIAQTDFGRYLFERDQLHRAPLVHILFVSALVTTADGYVVLVEMSPSTSAPGMLQLPGGNVDVDEIRSGSEQDLITAARRELAEEIGLPTSRRSRSPLILATVARASLGVLVPLSIEQTAEEVSGIFRNREGSEPAEVSALHFVSARKRTERPTDRSLHPYLDLLIPHWKGGHP